jgi:hypothetical protein
MMQFLIPLPNPFSLILESSINELTPLASMSVLALINLLGCYAVAAQQPNNTSLWYVVVPVSGVLTLVFWLIGLLVLSSQNLL